MSKININEILDFKWEDLYSLVTDFLLTHTYLKPNTLAKLLLDKLYNISYQHMQYYQCLINWTCKISNVFKKLLNENKIFVYNKGSKTKIYKKCSDDKSTCSNDSKKLENTYRTIESQSGQ